MLSDAHMAIYQLANRHALKTHDGHFLKVSESGFIGYIKKCWRFRRKRDSKTQNNHFSVFSKFQATVAYSLCRFQATVFCVPINNRLRNPHKNKTKDIFQSQFFRLFLLKKTVLFIWKRVISCSFLKLEIVHLLEIVSILWILYPYIYLQTFIDIFTILWR